MLRDKSCPECRWVPVRDESGRRRLEMRWDLPIAAPATSTLAKAA